MKRTRVLLFGLMVALLGLVALQPASAVPCYSCICVQDCGRQQTLCLQGCNGNPTCEQNCGTHYTDCLDGCLD